MMKTAKRYSGRLVALLLTVMLSFALHVDAKSGSSGFSGSRSSSSSFSSGSKSGSSGFSSSKTSSSKTSSSKSSGFSSSTSSKTTTSKPSLGTVDKAAKAKVESNYQSRSAAVSAYKSQNAAKYTSSYKSEPSTRPEHIPTTTTVGGTTYNVTYNQSHGGYGYWSGGGPGLGTWMVYDALSDAVMLNALMDNDGYTPRHTTADRERVSAAGLLAMIILFGVVVLVAVYVVSRF